MSTHLNDVLTDKNYIENKCSLYLWIPTVPVMKKLHKMCMYVCEMRVCTLKCAWMHEWWMQMGICAEGAKRCACTNGYMDASGCVRTPEWWILMCMCAVGAKRCACINVNMDTNRCASQDKYLMHVPVPYWKTWCMRLWCTCQNVCVGARIYSRMRIL